MGRFKGGRWVCLGGMVEEGREEANRLEMVM